MTESMVDTTGHAADDADAAVTCPMCLGSGGREHRLERGLILFCCSTCLERVTPNFAAYDTSVLPQALSR